jgi:hypothetical protein
MITVWGAGMKTPRKLKVLGIGAGSLLLLALVAVVVGYLSAPNLYLTRAIFWGESDYKDLERFPARTIHNAPPVSRLDKLPADNPYASQIEAVGNASTSGSFENYLDSSGTTAFLVVKDDKLLYERYFNGYDQRSQNTSFSMAKSFASTLVGIAIDEGYIKSVEEPITNYLPELLKKDKRFKSITIRHLLTMSSGIKYEEDATLPWSEAADDTKTYYATELRELALDSQIEGKPGQYFEYNNYNPLLVGMILERATGDVRLPLHAGEVVEDHGHGGRRLLEPGQQEERLREDGERGKRPGARLREVRHAVCQGGGLEGQTAHLPGVGRGVNAPGYEHRSFPGLPVFLVGQHTGG